MASLTLDRSSGDDPLLAIRRVPNLVAQLLATLLRLLLVSLELLLSLIAVPLTLPLLLLRMLSWGCSMLDSTLGGGTQGRTAPRGLPPVGITEPSAPEPVRRPERARP
ncbi:MAG: hypothetical protein NZ951_08440 [Dehalococcoidia bacterium]|nr:hypothetical protein [Dehalococcoidia bacterium]MDW8120473.1 hypothetical protein [Chloroflexota bacterium]